jgi:hypothetical protein
MRSRSLAIAAIVLLVLWLGLIGAGIALQGRTDILPEENGPAPPRSPVPGAFRVEINRIDPTYRSPRGEEAPRDGFRHVLVALTLSGVGGDGWSYEREGFALQDERGVLYRPVSITTAAPLPTGPLTARQPVAGNVIFELPTGATPTSLVYQPSTGQRESVRLP